MIDQQEMRDSLLIPSLKWAMRRLFWLFPFGILWWLFSKAKKIDHDLTSIPLKLAESYALICLIILVSGLLFHQVDRLSSYFLLFFLIPILRLSEILINWFSMIFIEPTKDRKDKTLKRRHGGKWLTLAGLNFLEVIFCFSLLYSLFGQGFTPAIEDPITAIYQSTLTVTTLGYGDIKPAAWQQKVLVIGQLLYFVMFFVLLFPIVLTGIKAREPSQ